MKGPSRKVNNQLARQPPPTRPMKPCAISRDGQRRMWPAPSSTRWLP